MKLHEYWAVPRGKPKKRGTCVTCNRVVRVCISNEIRDMPYTHKVNGRVCDGTFQLATNIHFA